MRRKTPITPEIQARIDAVNAMKVSDFNRTIEHRKGDAEKAKAVESRYIDFADRAADWAIKNDVDPERVAALFKALHGILAVKEAPKSNPDLTVGEWHEIRLKAEAAWKDATQYFRIRMDG